jgi:hypothetical protein
MPGAFGRLRLVVVAGCASIYCLGYVAVYGAVVWLSEQPEAQSPRVNILLSILADTIGVAVYGLWLLAVELFWRHQKLRHRTPALLACAAWLPLMVDYVLYQWYIHAHQYDVLWPEAADLVAVPYLKFVARHLGGHRLLSAVYLPLPGIAACGVCAVLAWRKHRRMQANRIAAPSASH